MKHQISGDIWASVTIIPKPELRAFLGWVPSPSPSFFGEFPRDGFWMKMEDSKLQLPSEQHGKLFTSQPHGKKINQWCYVVNDQILWKGCWYWNRSWICWAVCLLVLNGPIDLNFYLRTTCLRKWGDKQANGQNSFENVIFGLFVHAELIQKMEAAGEKSSSTVHTNVRRVRRKRFLKLWCCKMGYSFYKTRCQLEPENHGFFQLVHFSCKSLCSCLMHRSTYNVQKYKHVHQFLRPHFPPAKNSPKIGVLIIFKLRQQEIRLY